MVSFHAASNYGSVIIFSPFIQLPSRPKVGIRVIFKSLSTKDTAGLLISTRIIVVYELKKQCLMTVIATWCTLSPTASATA